MVRRMMISHTKARLSRADSLHKQKRVAKLELADDDLQLTFQCHDPLYIKKTRVY